MQDYVAQVKIARLQRQMEYVSSVINNIPSVISGVGRINTYTDLRAATNVNLSQDTVALRTDINGDSGLFSVDATDISADDGRNVIIDAAGRHWLRWGSLI